MRSTTSSEIGPERRTFHSAGSSAGRIASLIYAISYSVRRCSASLAARARHRQVRCCAIRAREENRWRSLRSVYTERTDTSLPFMTDGESLIGRMGLAAESDGAERIGKLGDRRDYYCLTADFFAQIIRFRLS